MAGASPNYDARIAAEIDTFSPQTEVHNLPDIFHYWSGRNIRPKLEAFGFSSPNEMFKFYLARQCQRERGRILRFISIGSGNCDLEIELAQHLKSAGYENFHIDCLDLNTVMLERGLKAAKENGVENHFDFSQGDFNHWEPAHEYDSVLASQALHHVVNLEGLFRNVRRALTPKGQFIVSDMIGRNGHQRWPEALEIVQEFWQELPPAYRYNRMLRRHEESFMNWDCSREGFEGIRAQDILPLLLSHFHFELFVPYGNVIDPFVDRAFGHNFDASAAWDRDFIDRVHQRDEEEMLAGRIKPVHMEAVLVKEAPERVLCHRPFTPEFCVRWPEPTLALQELENRVEELEREKAENVAALEARIDHLTQDKASAEQRAATLERQMQMASDSRWIKLGNKIGLGPKFR